MKKINKLTAAIFLPMVMLFSSCFDPIFYEIRKDVKPETATVSGNIGQITRFTMDGEEYIFTSADKGLRYKRIDNEEHDGWSEMSLPFELIHFNFDDTTMEGSQLVGVFANSNTLYLVSAPYITTGSEGTTNPWGLELWGKQEGGNWENISNKSSTNYFPLGYDSVNDKFISLFHVFQTNSPIPGNREVFLYNDVTEKYYELEGLVAPAESDKITTLEDNGTIAWSAAYLDGTLKFFASKAVTSDEVYDISTRTGTKAKNLYYADGQDLYHISADGKKEKRSVGRNISALATTKDSVLIGLGNITSTSSDAGGITRIVRDENGVLAGSTTGFSTNAEFQITTAYTVLTLLNATPEKPELESALYSSISFSGYNGLHENIGLWSYYPGRGNWNRE